MRKREATAIMIAMVLGVTAGCAPGTISRYAAQAQQAGEELLEGSAVQAAAEAETVPEAVSAVETDADMASATETAAETDTASESGTAAETDTAPESGTEAESETAAETDTASETGTAAETDTASESGTAAESGTETDTETASETAMEAPETELPAMMAEVPQKVQEALAAKADRISGSLAGKDKLGPVAREALQAVLAQEAYDDKTLCLQNVARYDVDDNESFLLFFESAPLTARDSVRGDLWYFDGEKAKKLEDDMVFTHFSLVRTGNHQLLLAQGEKKNQKQAQLYQVKEGVCVPCFADAVSIELQKDGFCVSYEDENYLYDPLVQEWDGTGESVPYFYELTEDGFVQQSGQPLTAEEFLAYIPAEEQEAAEWKEQLEEKFFTRQTEDAVYSYDFWKNGENRIGYRERRIGLPTQENGIDHAVAEYSYGIFELEKGQVTLESPSLQGKGYLFENAEEKAAELEELQHGDGEWQREQIDRVEETLSPAKLRALEAVCSVQEYSREALCFVSAADYDGNGRKEAFVAVGSYDGIFGASICDVWFVGEGEARLLAEAVPTKQFDRYTCGKTGVQLLSGFQVSGVQDMLWSVKDGEPVQLLADGSRIEAAQDGTIRAWMTGQTMPAYFYMQDGQAVEYGLEEIPLKTLKEYDNGKAVYKRLLQLGEEDGLSCLRSDNGQLHVMIEEGDGTVSYETYLVENDHLILTDCGEGDYRIRMQPKTAAEPETVTPQTTESETAASQEAAAAETEAETKAAETTTQGETEE